MISFLLLKNIIENEPRSFLKTYTNLPQKVRIVWIKKFLKKDISLDDIINFIKSKNYYSDIQGYKKSEHYLILKNTLSLDLEKYNWVFSSEIYNQNRVQIERELKIWLATR